MSGHAVNSTFAFEQCIRNTFNQDDNAPAEATASGDRKKTQDRELMPPPPSPSQSRKSNLNTAEKVQKRVNRDLSKSEISAAGSQPRQGGLNVSEDFLVAHVYAMAHRGILKPDISAAEYEKGIRGLIGNAESWKLQDFVDKTEVHQGLKDIARGILRIRYRATLAEAHMDGTIASEKNTQAKLEEIEVELEKAPKKEQERQAYLKEASGELVRHWEIWKHIFIKHPS